MVLRKYIRIVKSIFRKTKSSGQTSVDKIKSDYEYLMANGVETEPGFVTLHGLPIIKKAEGSVIKIGKGVTLVSDSTVNLAGINHPVILATYSKDSCIIIEDNVGMSGSSLNVVDSCVIRRNTLIGANVNIWDTDFHPIDLQARLNQKSIFDSASSPIVIGENVWIGANSTILKGVKIGNNTIVGAMSLVNRDLPSDSLCAGVPAKFIRKL